MKGKRESNGRQKGTASVGVREGTDMIININVFVSEGQPS